MLPVLLKSLHQFEFVFGQDAGKDGETFRANITGDRPKRTHRPIETDRMSDNRRRRGCVARHHHHAHAKGFQLGNQFCRVFAGRVAEGD